MSATAEIDLGGLEVQSGSIGSPLFSARTFSLSLPFTGAEKGVKLGLALQGWVTRLKGTDVSLVTIVNGQTNAMDFAKYSSPSGDPVTEGCTKFEWVEQLDAKRRVGANKKPDIVSSPNKPELDNSYMLCVALDLPSASDLRINVILLLHRHDILDAYLNVMSINASVRSEDKGAK